MTKERRRSANLFPARKTPDESAAMEWVWEGAPILEQRTSLGDSASPFEDKVFASVYLSHSRPLPVGTSSSAVGSDAIGDARIKADEGYYTPLLERFMRAQREALDESLSSKNGMPVASVFRLPFTKIPETVYRHVQRKKASK